MIHLLHNSRLWQTIDGAKGKKNIQKHLQLLNPSKQTEHIIIHQKRHKLDHSNALDMKSVHTTVLNMTHVQISKHI